MVTGFEPGFDKKLLVQQKHHDEKTLLLNIYEPKHLAFTARQCGHKINTNQKNVNMHMNLTIENIQQANNKNKTILVIFDFDNRV